MKRRTFLVLSGAAALEPLQARAQAGKIPVVGFLSSFTEVQAASATAALRRGLGENGLAEGQVTVRYRYADGQYDRLPGHAAEFVAQGVDVIVASGRPA